MRHKTFGRGLVGFCDLSVLSAQALGRRPVFLPARRESHGERRGSHPGDLGRRVRHRRAELGLTRAQVAERAGIDEALAYIEEQPASVRAEIVLRLDSHSHRQLRRDVEAVVVGSRRG